MRLARYILSLPEPLATDMRIAAAARGETIAAWVREAIREKLAREQA